MRRVLQASVLLIVANVLVPGTAVAADTGKAFVGDTIVITHDAADPLNAQLWSGHPRALLSTWPADVALVAVPLGLNATLPEKMSSVVANGAPHMSVRPLASLPSHIQHALERHGHERRVLQVQGTGQTIVGLGDNGIGMTLSPAAQAAPHRWTLALYGHEACRADPPVMDIRGRAVLIRRGQCPYVDKIRHAISHGAAAVLFVNNDLALNRVGGACDSCSSAALATLPKEGGEALWRAVQAAHEAGRTLEVSMTAQQALATAIRVSADGTTSETGAIPYPFNHLLTVPVDPFESLAMEAVHLRQQSRQRATLAADQGSGQLRVLTLFDRQAAADPKWTGQRVRREVLLPANWMQARSAAWDLELACEVPSGSAPLKSHCPPWDYIVNLYLCTTPASGRCELEVGRWITPYWSGGRWQHDATPLMGLLKRVASAAPRDEQGRARLVFEFHTIQPYRVSAALRLMMSGGALRSTPVDAMPLALPGGAMTDGRYSQRQPEVEIQVPRGVGRVTLAVMATGHGFADADKCAEFCNTVHAFSVDGRTPHLLSQPEAGTDRGCWDRVAHGVVPNQGGTWIYGRNGWCPGEPVHLREIDISADVAAARAVMQQASVGARRTGGPAGSAGPDAGADAGPDLVHDPRHAAAHTLPAVTVRLRHSSTVKGVDHQPPAKGPDGREPDARLDLTVYAVFW